GVRRRPRNRPRESHRREGHAPAQRSAAAPFRFTAALNATTKTRRHEKNQFFFVVSWLRGCICGVFALSWLLGTIRIMLPTIAREGDVVVMIDQRKLPAQEVYVRCKTGAEVARAIRT